LWLSELQLTDFRNYQSAAITLKPGPNLLYGANGEGKTNLVEAIQFSSNLKSHRVSGYQNLIRQGQPSAQVVVSGNHAQRELLVGIEISAKTQNRYFVNGNQMRKPAEVLGLIGAVMFAPEDLDLIRRDPIDRRNFLDGALAQLKPRISGVQSDYERVLKQRNALLKSARQTKNPDLSTLDIWDDQLVALGVEIILGRLELITAIGPLLSDFYSKLSSAEEEIKLTLVSAIGDDDDLSELPGDGEVLTTMFRDQLMQNRNRELERGLTLVGPHRDELLIQKNQLTARSHASQGEAWSLALGLKLALASMIRETSNLGDPVLLLDDVFAVLDTGRRQRLLEFVLPYEQVIITAADRQMAPIIQWAQVFEVLGGEVTAEDQL
jgi:DNA replication and repair protein RecF